MDESRQIHEWNPACGRFYAASASRKARFAGLAGQRSVSRASRVRSSRMMRAEPVSRAMLRSCRPRLAARAGSGWVVRVMATDSPGWGLLIPLLPQPASD